MKKLTNEEVIKRLNNFNNINFDYSNVTYINRRTPINIICKKHNKSFNALLENFLNNKIKGCELCGKESFKQKKSLSKEIIIEQFKKAHGERYDYSKINYIK